VIRSLPFEASVDTSDATRSRTDPSCTGDSHTVWYRYRARTDGLIWAGVIADFDATISVYTGTRDRLRGVTCGDDPPEVVWRATAGTIYHIMLASCCSREGGPATLFLQPDSKVQVDVRYGNATVDERTGDVMVRGRVSCDRALSVGVNVHLRQRTDDGVIATGDASVSYDECDGQLRRFHLLVLGGLAVNPGPARIFLRAGGCNPFSCANDEVSGVIDIVPLN
jgi:hypothetical protein